MKYVVLIGDGMSDYPLKELDDRTPLEVADIPNMDEMAKRGRTGQLKTVPDNLDPGSDVANMSIMGYNPDEFYTGRGPIEAGNLGIDLGENDVSFRCNLITEEDGILKDFSAGHISTEEANKLLESLNESIDEGKFYTGLSYRHNFVFSNKDLTDLDSVPPHDMVGGSIDDNIIANDEDKIPEEALEDAKTIKEIMYESNQILSVHEVNIERIKQDKNPANMVWLWGQGLKPSMPDFKDYYGLKAATITGVDLIKGLGFFSGMNNIDVPGATGYFDTDYKAKGDYAVEALKEHDLVFVHVEAPDEAGHAQNIDEKINAIEEIDYNVLGTILDEIEEYDEYKIAILPDHATPISVGTHTRDPVPFAVFDTNESCDAVRYYNEKSVLEGSLGLGKAYLLINNLINGF